MEASKGRARARSETLRSAPMAPTAEPGDLLGLLDLQEQDTAIGRLHHRRDSLPEAQQLSEANAQLSELSSDLEIATKQRDEIAREQDRIEGEMGLTDQKIQREEGRMFSGGVSNPKELSALQAEVEMLKRNKSRAEDSLLEVMVNRDQAEATVSSLAAERDQTAERAQKLNGRVTALAGEIDSELAAHSETRLSIAAQLPGDLVALYETIRDAKKGVGAAALEQGTCQGCHTSLPAREVERLKAAPGLQRCDHCRRILVAR